VGATARDVHAERHGPSASRNCRRARRRRPRSQRRERHGRGKLRRGKREQAGFTAKASSRARQGHDGRPWRRRGSSASRGSGWTMQCPGTQRDQRGAVRKVTAPGRAPTQRELGHGEDHGQRPGRWPEHGADRPTRAAFSAAPAAERLPGPAGSVHRHAAGSRAPSCGLGPCGGERGRSISGSRASRKRPPAGIVQTEAGPGAARCAGRRAQGDTAACREPPTAHVPGEELQLHATGRRAGGRGIDSQERCPLPQGGKEGDARCARGQLRIC